MIFHRAFRRHLAAFCLLSPVTCRLTQAQSIWTGSGLDNNWSTGANWQDGVAPTSDPSTALQFAGTTRLTPNADSALTLGGLAFNSGAGAFTLGGSALTFGAGGSVTNNSASLQTIANAGGLVLSGTSTWNAAAGNLSVSSAVSGSGGALTKTGAGTLTLSGTNSYSGSTTVGAGTLQFGKATALYGGTTTSWTAANLIVQSGATAAFNVGGTGEFTVANITTLKGLGSATGGFLNGSTLGFDTTNASGGLFAYSGAIANPNGGVNVLALAKLGTGTLRLSGSDTFTGGVTLQSGTLQVGSANALGTGRLTINGGALDASSGLTLSTNNAQTWNTSFTYAATSNNSLNLGTGAVTLGGNLTVTTNGNNFIVGGGTALTVGGGIGDGGNNYGLTKAGATRLVLNGANTYTGPTTVAGGLLQFGREVSLYNGNTAAWNETNLIVQSGGTAIFNVGGTGQFTSADLDALKSLGSATGGFLSGSAIGFDASGAPGQTFTYSSAIANPNGGANALGVFKQGDGTVILSGANTYTGPTTITRGVLQFAQPHALYGGDTAQWTASNLVVLGGTAAFNVGGPGEFTASDIATIAGLATSTGGFQTNSRLQFDTSNATGGVFDFNQSLAKPNGGANTVELYKVGAGTLQFSGNNSWTGDVQLRAGTMSVTGSFNNLTSPTTGVIHVGAFAGDTASLVVSGSLTSSLYVGDNGAGTLLVDGGSVSSSFVSIALNSGSTGTATVTNGGSLVASAFLDVGSSGNGTLLIQNGGYAQSGNIGDVGLGGTGVLTITDAGSTFRATSLFYVGYGGTGTVNVLNGGFLNAHFLTVGQNTTGTLNVSDAGSSVFADTFTLGNAGRGTVNLLSGGSLSGSGAITMTKNSTLNFGSSDLAHPTTAGVLSGFTAINGSGNTPGTINFNQTDAFTFSTPVSGKIAVVQRGAGTTTLTGANTYTSGTTVSGGTLALGASDRLADSGAVTVAGGTFDLGAFSETVGAVTLTSGAITSTTGVLTGSNYAVQSGTISASLGGTGALAKSTAGTVTLSGANTFTGATAINAGTLLVDGALGNSTVTVNSGGTLGGRGTIGGAATLLSGAHLAPGDSPGTITFTNGLSLAAGSALDFQLGPTRDLIRVSGGTLSGPASGTITLNIFNAGGFAAGTYTLFDFSGAGPSDFGVNDFALGSTIPGYNYAFAFNGSTLELTASAIPEPSTYALIFGALALGASGARRFCLRRRRAG